MTVLLNSPPRGSFGRTVRTYKRVPCYYSYGHEVTSFGQATEVVSAQRRSGFVRSFGAAQ